MKYKVLVTVIVIVLLIAGWYFFFFEKKQPIVGKDTPSTLTTKEVVSPEDVPAVSVFAKNLDIPWAIAFLPSGSDKSMLVTERSGQVKIVNADGSVKKEPAAQIPVAANGEGGLLGITIHPDFDSNHFVYLYYTYSSTGKNTLNRVARMVFENDMLRDEKIIVDAIPGALFHNGGRIQFGPDGFLYITTGDAQEPSLAQDTGSLAGKILRVTDRGEVAPGNPFGTPVYSYGHRNPQGIAWDSDGVLWETEHGRSNPTGFDEINLITPGKNYGWEVIQGDEIGDGMETPKKHSGANTAWAPAGAVFVGNSFYFAGLRGAAFYEAVIENGQIVDLKEHLKNEYGRLREVVLGPDGMLYVTTSNRDGRGLPKEGDDKILRINPTKL